MIDTGRLASRCVTFGGLAVSLAANLLHAELLSKNGDAGAVVMVGSALPPLFLLGAVEVVLSVRWRPGFWSWLVRVLLVPIAGISFYLSWLHMSELVLSWGASRTEAALYPIMIDVAMLLSAGAMILEDRTPDPPALEPIEDRTAQPDPVRTPGPLDTGPPAPSTPDPVRRTGPASTGPPSGPPNRTGRTRVEELLPVARPIVAAQPDIGWKALADRIRGAGHRVSTKTARDLRAALTAGEEVSTDGEGDDLYQGRREEGLVRV